MRPIQATIALDALRHNLAVVRQHAPSSNVMAVIKANGYGHGLLRVAEGLRAADGFAVLNLEEAIALRQAGYTQTILLLEGFFCADELAVLAHHALTPVVHSQSQLDALKAAPVVPEAIFLKINTGMNRLGFAPTDFPHAYEQLRQLEAIKSITLMTHFATADEAPGIESALGIFNGLTSSLKSPKSIANSASILRYPETHLDWVRPGIMLYGATPVSGTPAVSYGLKPVMTLQSEIIAIQQLMPGDSVGYGGRFTAEKPTHIGIVACGYADGYPRHAPNGTPIAVAGKLTRTIGRVSMDMLFADITDIPQAVIGSPVELWGSQVPVDAVAEASGTVGYELLCALAPRVPVKAIG
jgi:alanine racemase